MVDFTNFFSPAAWGSWNPPPQDLFPTAGSNGVSATPTGMPNPTPYPSMPTPAAPAAAPVSPMAAVPGAAAATPAPAGGIGDIMSRMKFSPQLMGDLQKMIPGQGQGKAPAPMAPIPVPQPVGPGAGSSMNPGGNPMMANLQALKDIHSPAAMGLLQQLGAF